MLKEDGTSSLRKAIRVLKCFSEDKRRLSMTEIAQLLSLPPGTASRILNALVEENFLERDERTKLYQLGVYCLRMGKIAEVSDSLRALSLPFMEKLCDRFNETVNMYIRRGKVRVCYAQCETTSPLKRSVPLGSVFTLSAGAAARCLLAWAPMELVREVIEDIRPFTENTITEQEIFMKGLEETRHNLYSVSYAEREPGVVAVAAPIFGSPGVPCASISIAGPEIRFTKEIVAEMICALRETSLELSNILCGG